MNAAPVILRNAAPSLNHSLLIQLAGKPPNRYAIGARVAVWAKDHRMIDEVRSGGSFCSQNDLRLHFGLGAATEADKVEVHWPDGTSEVIKNLPADHRVSIQQGRGMVAKEAYSRSARVVLPT
jgi:hypothetical protein